MRDEQQLVGRRIEPRAEAGLLSGPPGDQPVERVGDAGGGEHGQRPAEMAVDDQDDERRDEQHPQQRELIRQRQDRHRALTVGTAGRASRCSRSTIAIASAPVTGSDG